VAHLPRAFPRPHPDRRRHALLGRTRRAPRTRSTRDRRARRDHRRHHRRGDDLRAQHRQLRDPVGTRHAGLRLPATRRTVPPRTRGAVPARTRTGARAGQLLRVIRRGPRLPAVPAEQRAHLRRRLRRQWQHRLRHRRGGRDRQRGQLPARPRLAARRTGGRTRPPRPGQRCGHAGRCRDRAQPGACPAHRQRCEHGGRPRCRTDRHPGRLSRHPGADTEYWLGYQNFYVITRYNRSSFYAMSVFELAEALRLRRLVDAMRAQRR